MDERVGQRWTAAAVVTFAVLTGLASNASAAQIVLSNDVGAAWQNSPLLCGSVPSVCTSLVIGAPRLVPDMSNAGDLLQFMIDFHAVSVLEHQNFKPLLGLNIADANANEVFRSDRPGEDIPLQLTYPIPLSARNPDGTGFLPATDIVVNLGKFKDFGLLPPGDLLFTVTFNPAIGLPFNQLFGEIHQGRTEGPWTLTATGAGTVISTPEPATVALLLSGLTTVGIGAGWRRIRKRASHRIG